MKLQCYHPFLHPRHSRSFTTHERRGYWNNIENQRAFFDQLKVKLGIKNPEDWAKVTKKIVHENGGWFMCHYYKNSVSQGLSP
jgi:hypothetical protein